MSEEWPSMKPVKCGCGGNGVLNTGHIIAATGEYLANVKCDKCGIATNACVSMDPADAAAEAVESWNTAMGGNAKAKLKAFWDGMSAEMKEERTAKVDYRATKMGFSYRCCNCDNHIDNSCVKYCPHCGSRLEWNEQSN